MLPPKVSCRLQHYRWGWDQLDEAMSRTSGDGFLFCGARVLCFLLEQYNNTRIDGTTQEPPSAFNTRTT